MTYVYFIRDGDFVKIGESEDPIKRLNELQTGNPRELRLMCMIQADNLMNESQVHAKFSQYRIRGEWFSLHPEIEQFIKKKKLEEILVYNIRHEKEDNPICPHCLSKISLEDIKRRIYSME